MNFIDELGEACDKATDGPWDYSDHNGSCIALQGHFVEPHDKWIPAFDIRNKADAKYIALANPQTVRWLVGLVEEANNHIKFSMAVLESNGFKQAQSERVWLDKLAQGPTPITKEVDGGKA